MHFNVRIKATKANSKTRTKRVKKTATQVDATPSVDVKPIIVPAEPEEEWVTLPQAGDCISLRLDNEASINHLPTQAEIQYLQRLPTETKRYLAIVTGVSPSSGPTTEATLTERSPGQVLTAPTQKQPWCTCVVHILPPPPTQGGTIQDFHPRHWTVVRLRPREARREPLFAVAPRLADALYREAAWVAAHTDVRPLSAGRELSLDHWAASRWVLPELAPRSAYRTTVLPPGTVLHVPELDGYQAATFDYSWEGPYGLPQAYAYEHHLICL